MVTFTINIPQMLAYIPYMDPMGTRLSHGDIASEMFDPNTLALLVAVVVLQIAIRHRSKKRPGSRNLEIWGNQQGPRLSHQQGTYLNVQDPLSTSALQHIYIYIIHT
jgi:hypothetical protein